MDPCCTPFERDWEEEMDLHTITKLLALNCFMASIDLKDAYYFVPTREADRKLVSFKWKEQIHQFTCLPNGLSCPPRKLPRY